MQGLAIRESTIDDADEIAHVNALTWGDAYAGIVSDAILKKVDWAERRRWQQDIYASRKKKSFVATIDEEIVGYCNLGPMHVASEIPWVSNSDFNRNEKEWGEIYSIYVLKSYHRLGIGKLLFNKAQEWLHNLGYRKFQVYALKNNIPAINFYHSIGGVDLVTRDWTHIGESYKEIGMAFYI
jgi:ribosomal protein S18 acetylase RimI-like enzyme